MLLLGIAVNVVLIVTLTPGILCRRFTRINHSLSQSVTAVNEYESAYLQSREVTIVLILCGGEEDGGDSNGRQHKENAKVLLKSAAALARVPLRFIIVADPRSYFEEIVAVTKGWPEEYRHKVTLQYVAPSHSQGGTNTVFADQDCVTEAIFTRDFLRQKDSVLYLPNDIIFMRPPEDLWEVFSLFNSKQAVGQVPFFSSDDGSEDRKVSLRGKNGFNSGVVLMNLTRLRNYPGGGGLKAIAEHYDQYIAAMLPSGRELSHAYPKKFPESLFELECDWNFHRVYCEDEEKSCPAASRGGASMVHGHDGAFQDANEMKFRVFYETWQAHELGTPLIHLYSAIKEDLFKVGMHQSTALCGDVKEIDVILSQRLRSAIQRDPYLI